MPDEILTLERIGKAMDMLKRGVGPIVGRKFSNVYQRRTDTRDRMFDGGKA